MGRLGSILIVDPQDAVRDSTCRLLRRQGFECRGACDGDDAMAALQARSFDVMVVDIQGSSRDDLALVEAARELDGEMMVILVTSYPAVETAIRAIQLSVAAYLVKPLQFDELVEHIEAAIDCSCRRRTLSAVRARLKVCLEEMHAASGSPPSRAPAQREPVSIGTLRTLAGCLSDLLRLGIQCKAGWNSCNLCELLDCPQMPAHRQAITEAIEVLKKTKDTFKSRLLAELRTKLEASLSGKG